MEYNENSEQNENEGTEETNSMKQWFQDNLRVIISVLIVLIIAGGIYSYSNRTPINQAEPQKDEVASIENILGGEEENNSTETENQTPQDTEVKKDTNTATEQKVEEEKQPEQSAPAQQEEQPKEQPQQQEAPKVEEKKDVAVPATPSTASQETEGSFIETAVKGDGSTNLARRALANYLEKNPDSALTAEHKIYIEDYLRKHVGQKGRINIGTSIEFSKSLIQEAIGSSKNLNEKQLQNLHKYAVRVPSLS